ncbi:hypothetical protein ACSLMH_11855 [Flavobacterium columnare]|uniref:Lipoprotein n=1 Tax=Flavobacterium columnare TaxID=996 RepID=A0AA94F6F2_9FLAO|nr:hypothetical protein [Flavobacterium columnare]MBF6656692.1 hypothetical protein [Flavobacterium columnare]MCH4829705.1 hypothetical protein [Flavobacterium columnare]MCH4831298.1 hypothetical protein [Flavobacterium columnare]
MKNQQKRLKNNIVLLFTFYLLSAFFISCCEKDNNLLFTNIENRRYNILEINYTNFRIDGKKIYSGESIENGNNFFSKNNYYLVDSLKVYSIFRNLGETELNLNNLLDRKDVDKVEYIKSKTGLLLLDFGLKVEDSISKKPGDLILLKKVYDNKLKDTIFLFSRKFIWDEDITNIVASKKYGIMGFYDYSYKNKIEKEVYKYYGWTYLWLLDSSYKISHLRQLKSNSEKSPSLNLEKMTFLTRDW